VYSASRVVRTPTHTRGFQTKIFERTLPLPNPTDHTNNRYRAVTVFSPQFPIRIQIFKASGKTKVLLVSMARIGKVEQKDKTMWQAQAIS